eukprot:4300660-Pyramimonas_sp.AAC.1
MPTSPTSPPLSARIPRSLLPARSGGYWDANSGFCIQGKPTPLPCLRTSQKQPKCTICCARHRQT